MQMLAAAKLREAWGDKPCDHPRIEQEYHFGANTGEYVCTTCGEAKDRPGWNVEGQRA